MAEAVNCAGAVFLHIEELQHGDAAGRLTQRLAVLTHPSLLVVDEIGYLPISHTGAVLFFQLMNRRYEHAATVLTSNKGFEQWGEVRSSAMTSWPPLSSTECCISVISSTSAATAADARTH